MTSFLILDLDSSVQELYAKACAILRWAPMDSEVILLVMTNKSLEDNVDNKKVTIINIERHISRLNAWHQGAVIAKGEYLCLLHGDTDLSADALKIMREKLLENHRIGAVSTRTNNAYAFSYLKDDYDLSAGLENFPKVEGSVDNAVLFLQDFCILSYRELLLKGLEQVKDKDYHSSCYASIILSWIISKQGKLLVIADKEVSHDISGREDSIEVYQEDAKKFYEEYKSNWVYSSLVRRELLAMMKPLNSEIKVLDIGCAYGANLMLIGSYLPMAKLYGVDIDETSIQVAKAFGDVLCTDVETMNKTEWQNSFDYIIIGDCLEHLRDPWQTLKKIAGYLKPTGEVLISLPNINHISILHALLEGRFQYEPAGILDRTHLRFFTKDSIRELLESAGLRFIVGSPRVAQLSKDEEKLYNCLKKNNIGEWHLDEFIVYQYVFKAKRPLLTSIIILNRNLLSYTKQLIESIRQYTEVGSYEIIVVDNGSEDGSQEWLQQQSDVKLIINKENVGFPKGCNQGLSIAQGQEIMFLNNDIVVTTNWLDNLRKALYSDSRVGAVGPVTNFSVNHQQIEIPYRNENTYEAMEAMQRFAISYNKSDSHKWYKWMMLTGFCMLIKREVYEKIGGMDEAFTPGNYEDDDYCLRIRKAGYEILLCKDTFIHHFGSKTFNAMGDKDRNAYSGLLQRNRRYFCQKWMLNEELYHCYRTFLPNLQFNNEHLRIIEYEAGSTYDLYLLGSICPKGEIVGTTSNKADLEIGCSYPLIYAADICTFLNILDGEYQLIIIVEDVQKYGDAFEKILVELERHLSIGGWLITVKNGRLLQMQKE